MCSPMPYVELHCHYAFSFLDGASHPVELAAVDRWVAPDDLEFLTGAVRQRFRVRRAAPS